MEYLALDQLSDNLPHVEYPPHAPNRWEATDGITNSDVTNGARATKASRMVDYTALKESGDYTDLVSNLLHLAHSEGFDPGEVYRLAIDNFDAEAGETSNYPVTSP
jgi:hypothetical protein